MEIIERGEPPEEKLYTAKCHRCKSLLRFKQSEGVVTHDQRDGSFVRVICPVCGQTVTAGL